MAYDGTIFFANMGGGGCQNYSHCNLPMRLQAQEMQNNQNDIFDDFQDTFDHDKG